MSSYSDSDDDDFHGNSEPQTGNAALIAPALALFNSFEGHSSNHRSGPSSDNSNNLGGALEAGIDFWRDAMILYAFIFIIVVIAIIMGIRHLFKSKSSAHKSSISS